MNGLLVALLAQIILGSADVFDKMLLKRKIFDALVYTFWIGILGIAALALVPFDFSIPSFEASAIALISGALWIVALLFLFSALAKTEASAVLPLIGVLSPLFTLLFASLFLGNPLGKNELIGFALLLAGGGVLWSVEARELRYVTGALALGSAFFFGIANNLAKEAFSMAPFIPIFILIKLGGAGIALLTLFSKSVRDRARSSFAHTKENARRLRRWYLANRAFAAFGSLLLLFAISLSHPALVDATQSARYGIVFIAGWLLLKERFRGKALLGKLVALVIIVFGFLWLGWNTYTAAFPPLPENRPIRWGLTFSAKFARQLGLDPRAAYEAILNELNPRRIRLVAYWDDLEHEKGARDFSDLDWQIERAREKGVSVILAIGMKVPRWPECHLPEWAWGLAPEERETSLRDYMTELVGRYRGYPSIAMWQAENEPFLFFGECPKRGENFLEKEIALVKALDPARPILVTDGGEMGLWPRTARYGDVFGTSLYRKAYPRFIGPIFGVIEYPITPNFFRIKERVTRRILSRTDERKPFIVIELQGEVWGPREIPQLTLEEQMAIFDPAYFEKTIAYAKETGFEDYYLWGAEWWYWLRERYGNDRFWEIAKKTLAF